MPEQTSREIVSSTHARTPDCKGAWGVERPQSLWHDGGEDVGGKAVPSEEISKRPSVTSVEADKSSGETVIRSDVDIGSALRLAYENTVNEAIPPEMIELLSKLS